MRRWRRPSSLGPAIAWIVVVVGVLVASRTLIDTKVPTVGEFLPASRTARASWWQRLHDRRGTPPASAPRRPTPPAGPCSSLASPLWLFQMGLGLTVIVVGLGARSAWLGAWRLATVFPTNRARVAALVVYAAMPLLAGRDLDRPAHRARRLRRRAVVRPPAARRGRHRHRRPGVGGRRRWSTASSSCSTRERVRRTAVLAIVTAIAVAMAPAVLPVVAARRRRARRWPRCSPARRGAPRRG